MKTNKSSTDQHSYLHPLIEVSLVPKRRRWDGEEGAYAPPPLAVAVLHPPDELELRQRYVCVLLFELWELLVLGTINELVY